MVKTLALLLLALVGGVTAQFHMKQILDAVESPLKKVIKSEGFGNFGDLAKSAEIPAAISAGVKSVVENLESVSSTWKPPAFCNGLACPPFKVPEKHKDYELRDYSHSMWVTTQMSGISYSSASRDMFGKLFAYISGTNEEKMKIEMTCPVLIRIIPGQGPACESNFTMSFYLNNTLAETGPPQPTDKTVYLTKMPDEMMVYVRSFSGYDMFSVDPWIKEAGQLAKSIGDSSLYDTTHYFTAGYDSPFRIWNRHNEIWFLKK